MDATVDAVAPQFHVPCIPDLIKISRPNAPRKMPSAGYDARTLRKQLDALYTVGLFSLYIVQCWFDVLTFFQNRK